MGMPEGLKWYAERLDRQRVTDAVFLKKHGWTEIGPDAEHPNARYEKDGVRCYAFSTNEDPGAVRRQIDALIDRDGWRRLSEDTYLPACGTKHRQLAYYQSSRTGRVYQFLEVLDLYYNDLTEDAVYPVRCSELTARLNELFPEREKPDVMRVTLRKVGDDFVYTRNE